MLLHAGSVPELQFDFLVFDHDSFAAELSSNGDFGVVPIESLSYVLLHYLGLATVGVSDHYYLEQEVALLIGLQRLVLDHIRSGSVVDR